MALKISRSNFVSLEEMEDGFYEVVSYKNQVRHACGGGGIGDNNSAYGGGVTMSMVMLMLILMTLTSLLYFDDVYGIVGGDGFLFYLDHDGHTGGAWLLHLTTSQEEDTGIIL